MRTYSHRVLVVTEEEGAYAGQLTDVYFSPASFNITAFLIGERHRRHGHYVTPDKVKRLGRDVLFIKSLEDIQSSLDDMPLIGRSLRDIPGMIAMTDDNAYLGHIVDALISTDLMHIENFLLKDHTALTVIENSIQMNDEHLWIAKPLALTQSPHEYGFLHRLFGQGSLDQMSHSLQRALNRWQRSATDF